jgi:uncharacterized membrane protein YtjA (UPF0391 family)
LSLSTGQKPSHSDSRATILPVTFLVIALVAAFFGWGGLASTSAGMAQILFFVFLIAFAISVLTGAFRGKGPRT